MSYIEFDLGEYYLNECDNYDDICFDDGKIKLLANIAYRYQNPAKSLILRIGVGSQALVFVSWGIVLILIVIYPQCFLNIG